MNIFAMHLLSTVTYGIITNELIHSSSCSSLAELRWFFWFSSFASSLPLSGPLFFSVSLFLRLNSAQSYLPPFRSFFRFQLPRICIFFRIPTVIQLLASSRCGVTITVFFYYIGFVVSVTFRRNASLWSMSKSINKLQTTTTTKVHNFRFFSMFHDSQILRPT